MLGMPGPGAGGAALGSERAARVVATLVQLGADPTVLGSRSGRKASPHQASRANAFFPMVMRLTYPPFGC